MVYLASSPSLAILETLAHINPTEFGERKLLQLEITAPTIERVSPTVLLRILRDAPPHDLEVLTRQFGSQWALEGSSLLLEVPSMVVPIEKNYLLNPLHPETNRVRIIREEIVRLDWRIANWAQPDLYTSAHPGRISFLDQP